MNQSRTLVASYAKGFFEMLPAANPLVNNDFLLSSFLRKLPAEIRQQMYLYHCQCFPGMLRIAKILPLEDGEGKLHVHHDQSLAH